MPAQYVAVGKEVFVVNLDLSPPSCLPAGLDTSGLHDVTCVGDAWRRYLDPCTGALHDGKVYAEEARRLALL